ncbi:MAG: class I SAM-dependent methyltransferase [Chitinophagaceae bacterium]|nr:class I SAM-dependent methyltransferase [Chitinophagaceae bacterium]
MGNLYKNLAGIYEAMYQTFINYSDEYKFYSNIFHKYKKHYVAEIGCGTGNLAHQFLQNGFTYTGIDLSSEMLQLAQAKNPGALFLQADMRSFILPKPAEAMLMAGRTISYLITDEDVYRCFNSVYRQSDAAGIFCFDFIDASRFIPLIEKGKEIIHTASFDDKQYQRSSYWKINPAQSFTFSWSSFYYELNEKNEKVLIGKDDSVIRAYTKDDITLFLKLCGFEILECVNKPSYAFDTYSVTAQKH